MLTETQELARSRIVEQRKLADLTLNESFLEFCKAYEVVRVTFADYRQVWKSVVEDGQTEPAKAEA